MGRASRPASAQVCAPLRETKPGHQMQADWATVGRGADKLKVFIATLGSAYVEFCDDQRVETLIRDHENALLAFGGSHRGALRQHAHSGDRAEHVHAAAKRKNARYIDFLEEVLRAERDARRVRVREMLTLPAQKTLQSHDFAFATGAPRRKYRSSHRSALSRVLRTSPVQTGVWTMPDD
jgi:IstB-like ATP binding protein